VLGLAAVRGAGEPVNFASAIVGEDASFANATFGGGVSFASTIVGGDASFEDVTFEQTRQLGPLLVCGRAVLDGASFEQPVRIYLSSRILSGAGAVFRGGADVFVRWADVSLDDADFAKPSLVAKLWPPSHGDLGWEEPADDGTWQCRLARVLVRTPAVDEDLARWESEGGATERHENSQVARFVRPGAPPNEFMPRVVSVRRAKLAELTLSGVDLRACRFLGAHGLDELKLERVRFAFPPEGWQRIRWWRWVRWTRRQTVAEERHWRDDHDHGRGWYGDDVQAPDLPDASQAPEPEQIASVYRALRKGLEDSKDEPGAADFYYGEMEMRRHSTRHPSSRRPIVSIVWLYWLVSGYALRASRALIALAITVALGAVLLKLFGFDAGKHPDDGTLVFAAESSVSLLRAPATTNLTGWGHVIQITLRLAGPLFFGLALLSLRGRVKR
jgi:hypothetical protein